MKNWQDQRMRTARLQRTLEQYLDAPFRTSDQVLLYSFGLDPASKQTAKQLRRALMAADSPDLPPDT